MSAASAFDIVFASVAGILFLGLCALGIRESFKKKSAENGESGFIADGGDCGSHHSASDCGDSAGDCGGDGGGDGGGD